ncbi:MAG: hypothetical protein KC731_30465, partial [Myxococcales bacterium]|nr:hypothetical protein [Myxococcales bacterium]
LPTPNLPLPTSALSGYGELFLVGLADGVFGAMVGIGFAAALEARTMINRVLGGLGGLLAAVAAHVGYDFIARANPFGEAAVLRKWVALLLPVLAVIMVIVFALRHEKGAIAQELTAEEETGAVSADELSALQSFVAREREYFGRLLRFDLSGWSALRSLHNRQVQLALAKRKASLETDPGERTSAAQEVLALRKSVLELKQKLGRAPVAEGRS